MTTPRRSVPARRLVLGLAVVASLLMVAALVWTSGVLPSGTTPAGSDADRGGATQGSSPEPAPESPESPDEPVGSGDGGGVAGICAVSVVFEGRTYFGGPVEDVRPGRVLGTGTIPACNDTPGDVDDTDPGEVEVRAVPGESPERAVSVDGMVLRTGPEAG